MDTRPSLGSLLQQWESLTTAETDAIEFENWDSLEAVQRQKVSLKSKLAALDAPVTSAVQAIVAKLVEMERRNLDTLTRRMATLQQQMTRLEESRATLKRVHRSYVGKNTLSPNFSGTA